MTLEAALIFDESGSRFVLRGIDDDIGRLIEKFVGEINVRAEFGEVEKTFIDVSREYPWHAIWTTGMSRWRASIDRVPGELSHCAGALAFRPVAEILRGVIVVVCSYCSAPFCTWFVGVVRGGGASRSCSGL